MDAIHEELIGGGTKQRQHQRDRRGLGQGDGGVPTQHAALAIGATARRYSDRFSAALLSLQPNKILGG
jgi:hypothetical protein